MLVAMLTHCLFKKLFLLIATTAFIELMDGVGVPLKISKDMANLICRQRTRFSKREVPEEPVRFRYRPPSPLRCGWYSFCDCDKDGRCAYQKYDDCEVHMKEESVFPSNRIHGGHQAIPHSHPSMLYMEFIRNKVPRFCGAFAFQPYIAITAAHCTRGVYENDITLEAGRHNLADEEMMTRQVIQGVKKIHEHPNYNQTTRRNDISVLELYEEAGFTAGEYVYFAGIVGPDYNATGKATLVGWGQRNDGSYRGRLQEANMTIISDLACRKIFGTIVNEEDICAYDKGITGCRGDSGGPFYQYDQYGNPKVIGIERAGALNCYKDNVPTIFVEIRYYAKWIWSLERSITRYWTKYNSSSQLIYEKTNKYK